MSTQINLEKFEETYNKTYKNTLKNIVLHCSNLDDVNDILQDTYVELYKNLKSRKILELENEEAFIVGISNNIIKKHYRRKYKEKNNISIFENEENEIEIPSNIDLEMQFVSKENISNIWEYLKNKDSRIAKIFYLYYSQDIKISEIASLLKITKSATKNYLYRTVKELKSVFKKECD